MKLTAESTVLNDEAIGDGISDAGRTATTYITEIDNNGIKVHATNGVNANYVQIDANGMEVYKGGASAAMYGDTARVGKQTESHIVTSPDQFAMYNAADEPYFSVTNTGKTRSNVPYWQGEKIASGATAALGRFPMKNTTSSVEIRVEDGGGEYDILAGTLTNANVRTNNYSITYSVSGEDISGSVVITCENSADSPYVTVKAKNQLGQATRIWMVYSRSMAIPELNFSGDNKLLWSGSLQMSNMEYVRLSESVSDQLSGIALVWAKSDWTAPVVQYVPKSLVALNPLNDPFGVSVSCMVMSPNFDQVGMKSVQISDQEIIGDESDCNIVNATSGTKSSIGPIKSGLWELKCVYGV